MALIMNRQIYQVFLYRESSALIVRCTYFFHKQFSLSLSSLNDKIQNLVYVFTIINIKSNNLPKHAIFLLTICFHKVHVRRTNN